MGLTVSLIADALTIAAMITCATTQAPATPLSLGSGGHSDHSSSSSALSPASPELNADVA